MHLDMTIELSLPRRFSKLKGAEEFSKCKKVTRGKDVLAIADYVIVEGAQTIPLVTRFLVHAKTQPQSTDQSQKQKVGGGKQHIWLKEKGRNLPREAQRRNG